ncbi:hypothetical protein CHPG_00032 [Cellulophaga phage phi3:1]|nr:hypothetical protein CHPG_00032 [Cellulophaga phage phi3:1]
MKFLNEEIFSVQKTKLIVLAIKNTYNQQDSGQMELSLVLPESFTGEVPVNIFE